MLAALAERIDALGPRFRLPLLAVQAVEARSGRKGVLAFACDQDDLAVKLVAALIADVPATVHLLTEFTTISNEWPPNTRRLKRLSRRVDKILATMKARLEG